MDKQQLCILLAILALTPLIGNGHSILETPKKRRTCTSKVEDEKTKLCSGDKILDYNFSKSAINTDVWLVEQYIPREPDWEFVIYKNDQDVLVVNNQSLCIKPKLLDENASKNISVEKGCTRAEKYCKLLDLQNSPIVTGRLQLKKAFCFGNITIRAKLPKGDYIFPEIFLEDSTEPEKRIVIAFAMGNQDYTDRNGNDIGGKMLFGGLYASSYNYSTKYKYLVNYFNDGHIGNSWHTFSLIWKPDAIDLYMDHKNYGHLNAEIIRAFGTSEERMMRLIIGVGVGGPFYFPDNCLSSGQLKPYVSTSRRALSDFLRAKDNWFATWSSDSQLQVDYVSITAV